MALDPAQAAALDQPAVMLLHCLQWDIPGRDPLRLSELHSFSFAVDGAPAIFAASDATFGALGPISSIEEGLISDAPSISFIIIPPSNTAQAILTDPSVQGSKVRIWVPILDVTSGLVIGAPRKWFEGPSDTATVTLDEGKHILTVEAQSKMARLRVPNEGVRLSNGFHNTHHPGEKGFQYATSISRQVPWGSSAPAAPLDKSQTYYDFGNLTGNLG